MNGNIQPIQQRQQITITPDQLTPVVCENCGGEHFTEGVMLREVSPLISGSPEPKLAPIPIFICLNCKEVLQKTLHESLRKKKLVTA
jgi:hypothetical protein